MQGAENIASQLTNKEICYAKAHCKHLWVVEFPKEGRNLSLMEQLLGEDAQDSQRNWGMQDYKHKEGWICKTHKKEKRGVRGSMKSSWQEPRMIRMILWLCKKKYHVN